jgi:ABC-type uncharacterized transport system involved in gliding motility auxiliary subunit
MMNLIRSILQSFNNPKFKYGGYAALISGVVIALVVAVNILVDQIPSAKLDMTEEGLFTLSEQTETILAELEEPITVYSLFETGQELQFVEEILEKYQARSRNIERKNVDPYRNPGFLAGYKVEDREPGANSLIVEAGDRFQVISQYDFFNYSQPQGGDPFGQRRAQSMKVEQKLTGAILAVTAEKQPAIYVLQGHDEKTLPFEIRQQLREENYKVEDLNLLTAGSVPEDADILLVVGPTRDLLENEVGLIREFLLERRGHGVFMMDLLADKTELPNFAAVLRSYGVGLEPVLVVERDANLHVPQIPIGLVPEMSFHPVTSSLRTNDLPVLFPRSQAVVELENKRRTIEIEPILTTSEKAWGKVDLTSDRFEQTLRDKNGPFDLAVAVTDKGEREAPDSRLIVTGSSFVLYPQRAFGLPLTGPGNTDFVLNTMNWLQGQEELISIRPKSLIQLPLRMSQLQFFLYAGVSVILIPLLVLGAGLVIWLRRRHL